MSKIKLVIEIDEPVYHSVLERVKRLEVPCCTENAYFMQAIANGTPITEGDLISRSALRKCATPCQIHNGALTELCVPLYQIDNAPSIGGNQNE